MFGKAQFEAATSEARGLRLVAVCQGVLSTSDVRIEILQRFLVESNTRR
jgi:hypothetical protein